jgi:RNA polymerase sigma factor (TIGR02999 family)
MAEVTRILEAIGQDAPRVAAELLPLVYNELRRLAAAQMAREQPGQTLDATALVHEAYMRLIGPDGALNFANRRHFFAAAAEAMRRILVECARRKRRLRHGGERRRVDLPDDLLAVDGPDSDLLAVGEALDLFAQHDSEAAELVRLHVYAGLPLERAAEVLGLSARTAYRDWQYARAWLYRRLGGGETG